MRDKEEKLDHKTTLATNAYYLEGLWINGAKWNPKDHSIDECAYAHQTSCQLPTVHMMIIPSDLPNTLAPKKATESSALVMKGLGAGLLTKVVNAESVY